MNVDLSFVDLIVTLLSKHLNGTITTKETQTLNAWVGQSEQHQVFFDHINNPDYMAGLMKQFDKCNTTRIWESTQRKIQNRKQTPL